MKPADMTPAQLFALIGPEAPARLEGQDGEPYEPAALPLPAVWIEPVRTPAQTIDDAEHFTGLLGCTHVSIPLPMLRTLLDLIQHAPLDELTALRAELAAALTQDSDAGSTPPQEKAA